MRSLSLSACLVVIIATVLATTASALQTQRDKEATGSISGYVRLGDVPARGVTVLLLPSDNAPIERPTARATTDQDGHYRMAGVPAGQYFLQAFTPALIGASDNVQARQGKPINLIEGEAAEGIDIALRPGGVITGRVTDAEGQPLVQENVRLLVAGQQARRYPIYLPYNYMMSSTDDRGVYRLFGVPPGRYIVAVGVDTSAPTARVGFGNTYYPATYHPDATSETSATEIELAVGSEATSVDIVVGRRSKGYSVSGRIVDGYTGKPLVGMTYGYGAIDPRSGHLNSTAVTSSTSSARGEFRLDGVTPGRYSAFASPTQDSELYSDNAPFTVSDSDVTGLVVKVSPGSSIIGSVFIEGAETKPGASRFSDLRLLIQSAASAPRSSLVRVAPDGSFRAAGLPPGPANFFMNYPFPKGLALARVEREGVEQKNGIQVGSREEISGVKVVLVYGTGSIRGQVKVEDGEIPGGAVMYLSLRRTGADPNQGQRGLTADSRGRFAAEGLLPGDYELTLYFQVRPTTPVTDGRQIISKNLKQTVSVTNGIETPVTMIVDLNSNDR